jgi:3-oxoacyl-[acyl-carrier-protein] synthase II
LPGISGDIQERPLRVALLNAFGFGSNNAAVVFKQPPLRTRAPRAR